MAFILVADDSMLIRKTISNVLADAGHEIAEAVNGKDVLQLVSERVPDCLLLDLLMPEMGGFETMEVLNDKGIQIPTLVLTADIQHTAKSKALDLGARRVLNKPPNMEELIDAVNEVLQKTDP